MSNSRERVQLQMWFLTSKFTLRQSQKWHIVWKFQTKWSISYQLAIELYAFATKETPKFHPLPVLLPVEERLNELGGQVGTLLLTYKTGV